MGAHLFRYYLTVTSWPITELKSIDQKARKVINKYKGHHKCMAMERLYLPRSLGGRGIVSIENLWERKQVSVVRYHQRSNDQWLKDLLATPASMYDSTKGDM